MRSCANQVAQSGMQVDAAPGGDPNGEVSENVESTSGLVYKHRGICNRGYLVDLTSSKVRNSAGGARDLQ